MSGRSGKNRFWQTNENRTSDRRGKANIFRHGSSYLLYRATPNFFPLVRPIFESLSDGDLQAVSSPITLAECSIVPYRQGLLELQQDFADALVRNESVIFRITDELVAIEAVKMRVKYGLKLPDAIQVATAIVSNCDTFLTNDIALSKVTEIRSIMVSELVL